MKRRKKFTLLSHEDVSLEPGEKVISKAEFSKVVSAQEILKEAEKQTKEYKELVIEECEKIKEVAYKEGFQEGLKQLNEHILSVGHLLKTVRDEVNKKILPLAIQAAKKILGEELKLHPDRIVEIVKQALKPVMQHHKIVIYLNKLDLERVEKKKKEVRKMLDQAESFSLKEREDIEPGGCIIETEAGIINAQLENQWRALETAFKAFMEK